MSNRAFKIKNERAVVQQRPLIDRDERLWVLVPVKKLADSKQRLKQYLGTDREAFTIAMFRDVLAALIASEEVSIIVVVTGDPQLAAIANQHDTLVVAENGSIGLNQAIDLGIDEIRSRGGYRVAILPADIPLLTGAEFDRVVRDFKCQTRNLGHDYIGISASKNETGTNCLFVNCHQSFKLRYGPDSYKQHSDSAEMNNHGPISLYSATISMDIDERQDLDKLLSYCELNPEFQKTETWKFLQHKGITN